MLVLSTVSAVAGEAGERKKSGNVSARKSLRLKGGSSRGLKGEKVLELGAKTEEVLHEHLKKVLHLLNFFLY